MPSQKELDEVEVMSTDSSSSSSSDSQWRDISPNFCDNCDICYIWHSHYMLSSRSLFHLVYVYSLKGHFSRETFPSLFTSLSNWHIVIFCIFIAILSISRFYSCNYNFKTTIPVFCFHTNCTSLFTTRLQSSLAHFVLHIFRAQFVLLLTFISSFSSVSSF